MLIFVTGCQRSGTHFYADFISKLYGFEYVEESRFGYSDFELLKSVISDNQVIQCPALKYKMEEIKEIYPDSIIIWMYRNQEETKNSMESINWEKSSSGEIENLKTVIQAEGDNDFDKVISASKKLGMILFDKERVDQLINMESLRGLPNFRKNTGGVGLC